MHMLVSNFFPIVACVQRNKAQPTCQAITKEMNKNPRRDSTAFKSR